MFNIKDSKLYSQIMESLVGFFGLNKESATEGEIHDALNGIDPLEVQLQNARDQAAKDMADLKARLTELEAKFSEMETSIEAKDQRIAELQTEAQAATAENQTQITALKEQHKAEIKTLSGQIASLKAGQTQEVDNGGGDEKFETVETKSGRQVIAIKSDALAALVSRSTKN